MKFKFLWVALLVVFSSVGSYADEGLDVSYKLPLIPLEIVFGSDGISFHGTKTIVTPIGSFSLGYSKYASKFDEDYTYVIIEDMNQKKEHIYKIKDKKKLKLVSEGRTEITITKNRVHILLEKGSYFKVSFSVEEESLIQSTSTTKWIIPKNNICTSNGGNITSGGCRAKWKDAKNICSSSGGRLPSIEEFENIATICGGTIDAYNLFKNKNNSSYQDCIRKKGFSFRYYWSSTITHNYLSFAVWTVHIGGGSKSSFGKFGSRYVSCVQLEQ
jgi:hypothetical protein